MNVKSLGDAEEVRFCLLRGGWWLALSGDPLPHPENVKSLGDAEEVRCRS